MTEKCEKCGKEFDSERGLHIHQAQKHEDEDTESAEETSTTENQQNNLNQEKQGLNLNVKQVGYGSFAVGLLVGLLLGGIFLGSLGSNMETVGMPSEDMKGAPSDEGDQPDPSGEETADNSDIKEIETMPYDVNVGTGSGNVEWDGTEVELDGRPYLGDEDAEVTMVGYEDYFCPFCTGFHNPDFAAENNMNSAFEDILKNHIETGEVKYYFKNFPVVGGERPAEVSECFLEHGDAEAYWSFNYNHYQNSDELQELQQQNPDEYDSVMVSWAEKLDVEIDGFQSCIDNSEQSTTVQNHADEASALGATATPTQFVEGEMIEGAQPYSSFKPVIEDKLAQ
ncbi:DSBA oxidoreductase, partial [Candidatus Haloredivivus sp. G17]